MSEIKSFNQFNVKITSKRFEGNKISIYKLFTHEIIVHDFEITDSKAYPDKGQGKCLKLQISFNDKKHVVFTGSGGLLEQIQQVPADGFPFKTKIVEDNEKYIFT